MVNKTSDVLDYFQRNLSDPYKTETLFDVYADLINFLIYLRNKIC